MKNHLKEKIFNFATLDLGFDDCRFTDADTSTSISFYKDWLENNYHGSMKYLENHLKFKENPGLLLKGVKSAIVVSKSYKNTTEQKLKGNFKIARYAVGKDYHIVIKERLERLAQFLKNEDSSVECFASVDSAPIAERALALKAGIGFLGKNAIVIKPGKGSYFFLGVVLTTLNLENDAPLKWNCGECRLCIDACPTHAILDNSVVNATKCISYQTIERKSPLTEKEIQDAKGWIFGCDICQEVCPYNHDTTALTNWKEFLPEAGAGFDFFEKNNPEEVSIPKETPLYRSRKQVLSNWRIHLTQKD